MPSLRSYLLIVTTAIVICIWILFYYQTQSVLGGVFSDLETVHRKTISETAESMIEAKQFSLSTFRNIVGSDNELSSQFIVAEANDRLPGMEKRLRALRESLAVDYLGLIGFGGRTVGSKTTNTPPTRRNEVFQGKAFFALEQAAGEPALLSYSPLRNFGEVVGVVVIGYSLNGSVAKEVSDATNARVRFAPEGNGTVTLKLGDATEAKIDFIAESRFVSDLDSRTRSSVMWLAGLSLVLLFILLYAGLEFGFVRKFTRILSNIERAATDLDRGIISPSSNPVGRSVTEIGKLQSAFGKFSESLQSFSEKIAKKSRKEAFVEVAEQVAHDLKSPLSALDMMLAPESIKEFPEKRRLRIHQCLERIKDILQVLSARKNEVAEENIEEDDLRAYPIWSIVDSLLSEKRIQFRAVPDTQFTLSSFPGAHSRFVRLRARDFKRALSNLIDNAAQALMNAQGEVSVCLEEDNEAVILKVNDTGRGIPAELLPKLGQRGATFGKDNGSGLGLWNAKQVVEGLGGSLEITSVEGKGTEIKLRLPLVDAPGWAVNELSLPPNSTVLVLDDDREIHEMWKERFRDSSHRLVSFLSPEELKRSIDPNHPPAIFLCDYELIGHRESGLDVIRKTGLEERAVLVTSHHESEQVRSMCLSLGIRLMPKDLISLIPLVCSDQSSRRRENA